MTFAHWTAWEESHTTGAALAVWSTADRPETCEHFDRTSAIRDRRWFLITQVFLLQRSFIHLPRLVNYVTCDVRVDDYGACNCGPVMVNFACVLSWFCVYVMSIFCVCGVMIGLINIMWGLVGLGLVAGLFRDIIAMFLLAMKQRNRISSRTILVRFCTLRLRGI